MTTDLEQRLRRAFADEADSVSCDVPEFRNERPAGRRPPFTLIAAVAAVVVIVAAVVVASTLRRTERVGDDIPPSFVPAGVEQPLRSVAIDDLEWSPEPLVLGLTRPGSLRGFVIGDEQLAVYDTIDTNQAGRVDEQRCVEFTLRSKFWCDPVGAGLPSPQANSDLWVWADLPSGTSFVTAANGATVRWQRPVDGLAAFATDDMPNTVLVALDAFGAELARHDRRSVITAAIAAADAGPFDDLDEVANEEIARAVRVATVRCTEREGIGDVRAQASLADAAAWTRCVQEARAVAVEQFARLGGQPVDSPDLDPSVEEHEYGASITYLCIVEPSTEDLCRPILDSVSTVSPED